MHTATREVDQQRSTVTTATMPGVVAELYLGIDHRSDPLLVADVSVYVTTVRWPSTVRAHESAFDVPFSALVQGF